jgi:hypothetical protein
MADGVRATVVSGWPVLLAGMYARAMINTVPEDHAQQTSLIRAVCRCTITYIHGPNRIELSLSTDCSSTFLCSQEGPRQKRAKKVFSVLCQNGNVAKTGDVVEFKRAVGNANAFKVDVGELDIRHETGIRGARLILCGTQPICTTHVHCFSVCFTQGHGGSNS